MRTHAITTSCPDWADRLIAKQSIIPTPIYEYEADRALEIFKALRVVDLPGKPTFGECSEQWVFDFVRAIFGAYDSETGQQKIREFFLLISKKNSKSTLAAAVMLTALIMCWREEEEHLIISPTIEVALNSFKPAAGMVRADEELSSMFLVQDHLKSITNRITKSSLKVVAAESNSVSGKKAGRVLVDELWLFGKQPGAQAMLDEATGGQVSREEGFCIYLSTQSDEPPAGVFLDKLNYFRDVRDGVIKNNKVLPVIYEYPQAMIDAKDYLKPETFYIPNPNLGRSVSLEWLKDRLAERKDKTDGSFQTFLAKHLNVQIGLNLRSGRWAGADYWESCKDTKPVTLDRILQECEVVEIGIDGGGLDDLLGLAVIGRVKGSQKWMHWAHAWAHPSVIERNKQSASKLHDFARDGDLTFVDRIGQDVEGVADICAKVYASGLLDRIGVDPHGLGGILEAIEAEEIPSDKIIGISQGWKLTSSIKTTERKLAEGALTHAGSGLMAWCVGNAKVEPRGNAITITKQGSGAAKIDALMATLNAASLLALNPDAATNSFQFFVV